MIWDAIRLRTFSPDAFIDYIKTCGVDFKLTSDDAEQMRKAGVGEDVIRTIAENHSTERGKTQPSVVPVSTQKTSTDVRPDRVPAAIQQARLIRQVQIQQPPSARAAQIQLEKSHGPVVLEVSVDEHGTVGAVKPLSGHPVLAEIAAEAVKEWKYKPVLKDGRSVPVVTELQISFADPGLFTVSAPAETIIERSRTSSHSPVTAPADPIQYTANGTAAQLIIQPRGLYELRQEILRDPDRLVLDFAGGEDLVGTKPIRTVPVGDGFLKQIRVGVPKPGSSRVVLELQPSVTHSVERLDTPDRVVVHLHSQASESTSQPTRPSPEPRPEKVDFGSTFGSRLLARHRIALDAGHGGKDTGAIGSKGLKEKDVALDICVRLGKILSERLHQDVTYTRNSDTFLTLEERAQVANAAAPDLFLSVHANAEPTRSMAGFEAFVSQGSSTPHTPELARQSRALATYVHAALQLAHPSGGRTSIKAAPFVVLEEAAMPAALAEVGFLSSTEDEQFLANPIERERIADALAQAVASYLGSIERLQLARKN